jgi:hypothetical protein
VHTAEVEVRGDDIAGLAVTIPGAALGRQLKKSRRPVAPNRQEPTERWVSSGYDHDLDLKRGGHAVANRSPAGCGGDDDRLANFQRRKRHTTPWISTRRRPECTWRADVDDAGVIRERLAGSGGDDNAQMIADVQRHWLWW